MELNLVLFRVFNQIRVVAEIQVCLGKILKDEGPRKLSGPVDSEIEKNRRVVVFNQGDGGTIRLSDNGRFDKLVGFALGIGHFDCLFRRFDQVSLTFGQSKVGFGGSIPPQVPVHRPVSTHNRGYRADTLPGNNFPDGVDVGFCRSRRRIPAVGK